MDRQRQIAGTIDNASWYRYYRRDSPLFDGTHMGEELCQKGFYKTWRI